MISTLTGSLGLVKKRQYQTARSEIPNDVLELALAYGRNPTTFMSFYKGFQFFHWNNGTQSGVISYVETQTAWVGAGDPIASPECHTECLRAFFAAAHANGKQALLLPVSPSTAELARQMGYFTIQIGSDPWFSLTGDRNRSDFLQLLPIAKQLRSEGGKVSAFDPDFISQAERAELNGLTEKWLESRKCAPLGFLNRLEPWALSKHKRYFKLTYEGAIQGFLAAVPVPGRNAWYLVDLIRHPNATAGTTELLIIEAMDQLRSEGAEAVTLGMSPLANTIDAERRHHPRAHAVLDFVFDKLSFFYGFKSLFQYKNKFRPDSWESSYLVVLSPRMNSQAGIALFGAIFPQGLLSTTFLSLSQSLGYWTPARVISSMLSGRVVPLPLPSTWSGACKKSRLTLSLIALQAVSYLAFGTIGNFMWSKFSSHPFSLQALADIIGAGFSHTNVAHLFVNSGLLLIFGSSVELVLGARFFLGIYLAGLLLTNPICGWILSTTLKLAGANSLYSHFIQESDVGNSLAVFALIGSLIWIGRYPRILAATFTMITIAYCVLHGGLLPANHLFALLIGYGIARKSIK